MYKNKSVLLAFLCLLCISGYSQSSYYVSTIAGDTSGISYGLNANAGYQDGPAITALFNSPYGIAVDTTGDNLYVADSQNNIIRKINLSTGIVTTIAGDTGDIKKGPDSNIGYVNGAAMAAKFSNPFGVCVDDTGNVYVADTYNDVIRKISAATGKVSTYAGKDSLGIPIEGYVDGPDSVAEFFAPTSLAIDASGNLYVADDGNDVIREITTSGMVTTLAGQPGISGYVNGPVDTVQFYSPYGIALGNNGAIFVSQSIDGYNAIRRLYHDTVTTYSGYDTIGFDTDALSYGPIPSGLRNGYQNVYRDSMVINSSGDTTSVMTEGVLYNEPTGITFLSGNLVVADEDNNVIRIMNAQNSLVSTLAGNDSVGFRDGVSGVAEFYNPVGVAADKKGNVYVADLGNNLIRKISTQIFTGITPVKKSVYTLNAYPNPCNDRLNIVSNYSGEATLLDVTGRVIWTDNNFKSPYILSTSGISPGIYFLRISSPTATEIKKIEVVR